MDCGARAGGATRGAASGCGVGSTPAPTSGNCTTGRATGATVVQLTSTAANRTSARHPGRIPLIAPSNARPNERVATHAVPRSSYVPARDCVALLIVTLL